MSKDNIEIKLLVRHFNDANANVTPSFCEMLPDRSGSGTTIIWSKRHGPILSPTTSGLITLYPWTFQQPNHRSPAV